MEHVGGKPGTLEAIDVIDAFPRELLGLQLIRDRSALSVVGRDDTELAATVVVLDDVHNRANLFDILYNKTAR